ncbi:MAG: helix-turn-helix domain-containing protein [Eubacteriales bacterium]|jgi:transcriptional regulator with XRE-family HTH domain
MVTLAQRIAELRSERNMSRPALSTALGLPRNAVEKFETGRQTPTQEQQNKIAAYFGVSPQYLRGESSHRTRMENWMEGTFPMEEEEPVTPRRPVKTSKPAKEPPAEPGALFGAFLGSDKFQDSLRKAMLDVLRSKEGQELLVQAIRRELEKQKK